MYSSFAVANAFIGRSLAGKLHGLNSMKLQKLMYFTQAWHLKGTGLALFDDTFVRGQNGPVLPSIEYQLRSYGSGCVGQFVTTLSRHDDPLFWMEPQLPASDARSHRLIDAILSRYGAMTAQALSERTHLPRSAWSQGPVDRSPMLNESIRTDPTL